MEKLNKLFKIYSKIDNEYYVYNSLHKFCIEFNLTERLLRYTNPKLRDKHLKDKSFRYQEYHKGFKIVETLKGEFILIGKSTQLGTNTDYIYVNEYEQYYKILNKDNTNTTKTNNTSNSYSHYNNDSDMNYDDSLDIFIKKIKTLNRQLQRTRDENTLLRKTIREDIRKEVELSKLTKYIMGEVSRIKPIGISNKINKVETTNKGFLVFSDWHIGKKFSIENNKYDYEIALERLNVLFDKVVREIKLHSLNHLSIYLLGDFIHSQHREDMKYTSEFVEVEAGLKCFELIKTFIDRLLQVFPNLYIEVDGIVGNESRLASNLPHTNIIEKARNSIDYIIYNLLKVYYKDLTNRVLIHNIDEFESVVKLGNKYIALIHGDKINHSKLTNELNNLKLRLQNTYNIIIDYVLLGHIHSTLITDFYARNSSLVGADGYATIGLNIPESKTSQLFGVVYENDIKVYSLCVERGNDD